MFGSIRRFTVVMLTAYVLLALASSTISATHATHTVTTGAKPASTNVLCPNNIDWC
jgi:hypothetical protein